MAHQKEDTMTHQTRGLRVSPQQQNLWLLQQEQFMPYIAQSQVLIEGNIDVNRLYTTFQKVLNRHEIFRVIFHHMPGIKIPILAITDCCDFAWQQVDLEGLSLQEQTARVEQLFQEGRINPLNIEHSPLLRITLATLSTSRYMLIMRLPSLCADIWTLNNLIREISQCYAGEQQDNPLDDEIAQYFDFSEWQSNLIQSSDAEPGLLYWRQKNVRNLLSPVLPVERRAAIDMPLELQTLTIKVDHQLSSKIDALTKRCDISVATFLLACWETLLWRISGESNIVVRSMFDGRSYREFYDIMGPFSRAIPIHIHFNNNLRFKQIATRLDSDLKEHHDYQEYFVFEQDDALVEDFSRLPIDFEFNNVCIYQPANNIVLSPQRYFTQSELFKLKLFCTKKENSLTLEFQYQNSLFSNSGIAHLAEGFVTLLTCVVDNPEVRCDRIEIISAAKLRNLLLDLNNTRADYPSDKRVHQLFEEQVLRTPAQTAVTFGEECLTYAELNARANQVAHYLQKLGVGPDVPIGLYLNRSIEMVVGLLGVLKVGGTYIPLDPQYPKERLVFTIEETKTSILLTQGHLAQILPGSELKRICLDSDWTLIALENETNPVSAVTPDNLAYIIYTSGSTGRPKGVMIPHRGLVNYLSWCTKTYPLAEGHGSPVHSPLGFDLTITSLLSPLMVGQQILLVPETNGIEGLKQVFELDSVFSLVKITPTHLDLLRQQLPAEKVANRTKAFIIGGEMLLGQHLTFWKDHAPTTRLINEYGPTETVVGCCTYEVLLENIPSGSVPIGHPIANTQIYVLDKNLEPVPVGVPGELYIAGDGLARGYFNQPALTAERFIPNPFADQQLEPGFEHSAGTNDHHPAECSDDLRLLAAGRRLSSRLYRTGDLARYLTDGNIEFLGRVDQQVKLQGFRIELEEIEAILREHLVIREASVLVREDIPGEKRLVAYLVTDQAPMPSIEDLRTFLQRKLPAYMIPTIFMRLYALPLTPNGKIDRQALPVPEQSRPNLQQDYVAPQTAVQRTLVSIWEETLNLNQVGIHDNFFTLGGDSIRSVRVVALAMEQGLNFTVQQLFQYPTIYDLIQVIESVDDVEETPDVSEEQAIIAQILEELAGLSEEEVRDRLLEDI